MREHFVLFSTTFVLTLLAIFILIPLAHKIGLVDKPHGRKQHVGSIPLIGGISIFSGVAVTLLIFGLPQDNHWYYLLCGGSIVLLGVFDDFLDLSVKLRLCAQLIIGAVMIYGLQLYLDNLGNLVGLGDIELGYIGIPLTLIAVIAAINAFNMIDGIDGLAGMLSGVSFVSLTLMMGIGGQLEHALLPMVLVFALIPYLLFNLDLIGKGKGKIFMGDAGSMLIGLSVIWLLIIGSQSSTASFRPVTALWVIAVPLMDMVAIMIRRVRKGQSPFMADREHLHHIFLRLGLTSRQALVVITSLASMLATIGIVGEYLMVPDLVMLLLFLLMFSLYSLSLQYIWRITRFIKRYKAKNRAKTFHKLLQARAIIMLMERFFRLGAGAIITFMVARMLGDQALGTYGVVMVWAAFLAPLSGMGLNNLVQKMASSQTSAEQSRVYLQTALWLRLLSGILFGGLMILGFALFYPHYFQVGPWQISTLFMLQTFSAMMLCEYEQNYRGHFRAVALSKVLVSVLTLAARIIALIYGAGIDILLLVVGIEFLLTGAMQYYWYRRYATDEPGLQLRWLQWSAAKALLARSSWIWMSAIVSVVYLKIDTIMIEQMIGIAATGQYTAVARLSELWYVIPATLAARYYPDLLKAYHQSWEGYLWILKKRSIQFFALAVVIAIFMTLTAKWIMLLAYGEKFVASATVLQIHVWAGCFIFVRALISQHLIITGNEPLSLLSHGVGAILNVLLNMWLIPIYGIEGAAWATLISYAYASFFFLLFAKSTRTHLWQLCKVKAKPAAPAVTPE